MATLTLTVAASADDALVDNLGYADTGTTMGVGGTNTTNANHGQGWRFLNVTLTAADTATSVVLKLMKSATAFSQQDNHWTCMAADNIATFSSGAPPGSYAPVATVVNDQNNVNETDATVFNFPRAGAGQTSFAGAINNVLARAGWASGNALAVGNNLDQDTGEYTTSARKFWHSWDSATVGSEPQLVITYTPGAAGGTVIKPFGFTLMGVQ